MFGFGRKNDEEEVLDHAPMPAKETPQEQFVHGLSDPTDESGKKRLDKKRFLVLAVGAVFLLAGIGYFSYDTFKSLGIIGRKTPDKKTQNMDVSEEAYLKLMQERKEMTDRIRVLEDERSRFSKEIDQKITGVMSQFGKYETMRKTVEGFEEQTKTLAEQNLQLSTALKDVLDQLKQRPETAGKEPEPILPRQGSAKASIQFSGLEVWGSKVKDREESMKKESEKEPAFTDAPGVQVGVTLPGILKTTLVSSKALEQYFAVVETTENVEVFPGMYLPKGVRFLGKAESDYDSRRIYVTVSRLQYGTVDMGVNGVVLDERGTAGLVTKYIDPMNQAMWSTLLPNLLSAAASAAQDMTTAYTRYGEEYEEPKFNAKNVALQGIANSMQLQSQIILETQSRKKPVIIVKSGIPVSIQLRERLPMGILLDAGIVENDKKPVDFSK